MRTLRMQVFFMPLKKCLGMSMLAIKTKQLEVYADRPSLENSSHQLIVYRAIDRYCIYIMSQSTNEDAFRVEGHTKGPFSEMFYYNSTCSAFSSIRSLASNS